MRAEIITIGDELLIGQVVDTNSVWMAQCLNRVGVELYQITSVHDDAEQIVRVIDEALRRSPIVLTTGGLGPTKDDITKHVLCRFFDSTLVPNEQVRQHVMNLYQDRPEVLNRLTETQWLVPACATILPNRVGSAPLMVFEREGHYLACMPGVPSEMQVAMEEQIIPYLQQQIPALRENKEQITHLTCMVAGIPESALELHILDFEQSLPDTMHLAYLPQKGAIRLRLSGYNVDATLVKQQYEQLLVLIAPWLKEKELPL